MDDAKIKSAGAEENATESARKAEHEAINRSISVYDQKEIKRQKALLRELRAKCVEGGVQHFVDIGSSGN